MLTWNHLTKWMPLIVLTRSMNIHPGRYVKPIFNIDCDSVRVKFRLFDITIRSWYLFALLPCNVNHRQKKKCYKLVIDDQLGFILMNWYDYYHWQGYAPKKNRIHYSGPLVPPGGNMDEMLKEHERQIQHAVRKARFDKTKTKKGHTDNGQRESLLQYGGNFRWNLFK